MRYSELIQLYFERSNALQWYWTLYVIVIGGLLAFSSLRVRRDSLTGLLVTILLCMFAYKNLAAIRETMAERSVAFQAIHDIPATAQDTSFENVNDILDPTLVAPEYNSVRNFHISSDVLTIAAIWAMELRRIKNARREVPK